MDQALQEQAINWLRNLKSMQDDPAFFEAACAFVPTIPLKLAGSVVRVGIAICWTLFPFRSHFAHSTTTIWARLTQPGTRH